MAHEISVCEDVSERYEQLAIFLKMYNIGWKIGQLWIRFLKEISVYNKMLCVFTVVLFAGKYMPPVAVRIGCSHSSFETVMIPTAQ